MLDEEREPGFGSSSGAPGQCAHPLLALGQDRGHHQYRVLCRGQGGQSGWGCLLGVSDVGPEAFTYEETDCRAESQSALGSESGDLGLELKRQTDVQAM